MVEVELLDLDLASPAGVQLLRRGVGRHGAWLARACALPKEIFLLRSAWMPGLRFVGSKAIGRAASQRYVAKMLNFSLGGAAEHLEDAVAACLGEAIERLSQLERLGDVKYSRQYARQKRATSPPIRLLVEDALARNQVLPTDPIDWVEGTDLFEHEPTAIPADWCLRRGVGGPLAERVTLLSNGTAAGTSLDKATARAILELIERDAAAHWWHGGVRGRPIAHDGRAMAEAVKMLDGLRSGMEQRLSWVLDITTDLPVPVMAALSFDCDGSGFSCGLGAGWTTVDAARHAIIELGQMELALQLARYKQSTGAKLNEVEQRHLLRAASVHADRCELVHPRGTPRFPTDGAPSPDLDGLKRLLAKHKIDLTRIDHSRADMPLAVAQVISAELQPLPFARQSARLRKALAKEGRSSIIDQAPLL